MDMFNRSACRGADWGLVINLGETYGNFKGI